MKSPFPLGGMSIGINEDKTVIRVNLYSIEHSDKPDDVAPDASFVIPNNSYNSLITSFIEAGKQMKSDGVDLGSSVGSSLED